MDTVRRKVESDSITEFRFDKDGTAPGFIAESFADWLADYISDGAEITDGQTIQFGFALLRCSVDSRALQILAPDFQTMPVKWIDNLGPALGIIAAHKYTPESLGLTPDVPSLSNTVVVGNRFDRLPMFASRQQQVDSNPNDSGWFIGSVGDDVDNNDPSQLRLMSLYEAALDAPRVLDFLSLPAGCEVLFSESDLIIRKDGHDLEISEGSYLDLRLRGG